MQPFNFVTMTAYSGQNAMALSLHEFPAYATFNQIKANGGMVKKGEHGTHIFCGYRDKKVKGKIERVPVSATVFHIDQCDLPVDYLTWIAAEQAKGNVKPSEVQLAHKVMVEVLA